MALRKTGTVEEAKAQDSHIRGITTLDRLPQPLLALPLILRKTGTVEEAKAQDAHGVETASACGELQSLQCDRPTRFSLAFLHVDLDQSLRGFSLGESLEELPDGPTLRPDLIPMQDEAREDTKIDLLQDLRISKELRCAPQPRLQGPGLPVLLRDPLCIVLSPQGQGSSLPFTLQGNLVSELVLHALDDL